VETKMECFMPADEFRETVSGKY